MYITLELSISAYRLVQTRYNCTQVCARLFSERMANYSAKGGKSAEIEIREQQTEQMAAESFKSTCYQPQPVNQPVEANTLMKICTV